MTNPSLVSIGLFSIKILGTHLPGAADQAQITSRVVSGQAYWSFTHAAMAWSYPTLLRISSLALKSGEKQS